MPDQNENSEGQIQRATSGLGQRNSEGGEEGESLPINQADDEKRLQIVEEYIERFFSGPLPPPEMLRAYNEIEPGLGRELIEWAKKESDHRRGRETKEDDAQVENMRRGFWERRWGQICGLIFGLGAVFGGVYAGVHGAEITGSFIGVGGIGSIVTAFIYGPKKDSTHDKATAGQVAKLDAGSKGM